MTQLSFTTGTLITKRTDVPGGPPALLGVLSEVTLEFNREVLRNLGQSGTAVLAASAEFQITGSAKFARFQATQFNTLFLGTQTLTLPNSMLDLTSGEDATIPASPSDVTVAHASTFGEDFGVFNSVTGVQFTPTTGVPSPGQYAVAAGVYVFDSADAGTKVTIYYQYQVATGTQIGLYNQVMGPLPTFELILKGALSSKELIVKLNRCVSNKLTFPFINQKYAVPEFEFEAISDDVNQIGTISLTE
jgi:hypothetical protein